MSICYRELDTDISDLDNLLMITGTELLPLISQLYCSSYDRLLSSHRGTEVRLAAVKSSPDALTGKHWSIPHQNTRFVPQSRFFSLTRQRECAAREVRDII